MVPRKPFRCPVTVKHGLKVQMHKVYTDMQRMREVRGNLPLLRTVHVFWSFNACCFKRGGKISIKTIYKVKPLKPNPKGMLLQKTLLNTCCVVIAEDVWYILQCPGNSNLRSVESQWRLISKWSGSLCSLRSSVTYQCFLLAWHY